MDSAQNETINVFICQRCDQQFMGKTSRKICPPCGTLRKCPDCSIKVNIKTAKCKCGKVLYKGKEQKLEERRQAGADMKRNPGYAIDQLRAAAAYAYGAGYGVFAVAFKQGPGDNYLRQIVIKEGLPDYSEEEAASLNYPNWSLLRQSAIR